jgi:hypothetical protein
VGNSLMEHLMLREQMKRQAQLDALAQQQAEQRATQEKARLDFDRERAGVSAMNDAADRNFRDREFARLEQRDAAAADERAGARRAEQNKVGVRQMAMEGLGSGAAPGIVQRMVYGETGETLPADIVDPDRATKLDDKNHQQAIELAKLQGDLSLRTVRENNAGRAAEAKPTDAGDAYAEQTAGRVIEQIDQVLPKINNWTAGIGGNLLAKTGVSQNAVEVQAELEGIAGNIAFNALQQMRNASKTGGALGSIAQQELRLLQSVEGSIRQDRRPANLKAQLELIKASMQRFATAQGASAAPPPGPGAGGGPGRPQEWIRDPQTGKLRPR